MKLSAQEEYGLRCLLHMARQGEGASLSIPEISRAEGLSIPNVAKLMRLLRMGGFVASVRGQSGGYTLSRTAEQITVGSVLELLGGRLFGPSFCDRHSGLQEVCAHNQDCSIRPVWQTLQVMIDQVLNRMTLGDLHRNEAEMMRFLNERTHQVLPVSQIRHSA
ncbi:MAG: Rrf2 family transcriptional regulator [Bryobacteraceae bacterium]|nr:Rrf2 family transcriptional regulator [Bryobacteraceae bacterium]